MIDVFMGWRLRWAAPCRRRDCCLQETAMAATPRSGCPPLPTTTHDDEAHDSAIGENPLGKLTTDQFAPPSDVVTMASKPSDGASAQHFIELTHEIDTGFELINRPRVHTC